MTLTFNGRDLVVTLPSSRRSGAIKQGLGGRRKGDSWVLPPTSENVLQLVEWYGDSILKDVPEDIRDLAELCRYPSC